MTLILTIATLALLTFLGLSCRRARLDLEEQLCDCGPAPVAAAVGFGPSRVGLVPIPPVLVAIDGGLPGPGVSPGQKAASNARPGRRSHLQVVEVR
jgi:hypothetical protein